MRKNFRKIRTIAILLVAVLISIVAFVGIFTKQANAYKNIIPDFKLGKDLFGKRELIYKPSTESESKKVYVDSEGNILGYVVEDESSTSLSTDETTSEGSEESSEEVATVEEVDTSKAKINYATETREIKDNEDSVLTKEGFEQTKRTVQKRLSKIGISEYNMRLNDITGELVIETSDDTDISNLYQLVENPGKFEVLDSQTGIILMDNRYIDKVSAVYTTTEEGYQAYMQIAFNKEGTEILKNISSAYVQHTDNETEETTIDYIEIKVDGSQLIKTYFAETIDNGLIQISYGEPTTETSEFRKNYTNALRLTTILNNGKLDVKYSLQSDNFVKAYLSDTAQKVCYVTFAVALACVCVYFTIIYKGKGLLAGISNIGYSGAILLTLRYTNVIATYSSIITYVLMIALNVVFLNNFVKRVIEEGTGEKAFTDSIKKFYMAIIPVIVLAVVFTFATDVSIASMGMCAFWSIFAGLIYNFLITRTLYIGLDKSNDDSLERKIEENKKAKKKQVKQAKKAGKTSTNKSNSKKGANK